MRLLPLQDRVVVRRIGVEEKTKSGIIIPDTAKEKPEEGEVLAVGPGVRNDRGEIPVAGVKPGDRIVFGKWSGNEIVIGGEEVLVMKESDIIGILAE